MIRAEQVMPLAQWREHRRVHRKSFIAHRRARTIAFGPVMRLQFEDADTVRYQIQEVLHAENLDQAADVAAEIRTYAHLLPSGTEWKATLQIEIPEDWQRRRELPRLSEAVHRIYLETEQGTVVRASVNDDLPDRHLGRPSAVHFLRFELTQPFRLEVLAGAGVTIGCKHDSYPWSQVFPATALTMLAQELDTCAVPVRPGSHAWHAGVGNKGSA